MTAASEAAKFQEAAAEFAATPNNPGSIETMMKLALHGKHPGVKRWATSWLEEKCNIVVADESEGTDHATAPEAANIR